MKFFRSIRVLFLALALCTISATASAGVLISVSFAPPPLPVYVQPPCPEPGWMWTPGYWAYGPDGYYWVPGTWVPAPYVGALWTPGYWGWSTGFYIWHPGYWGRNVGYYGGINYGFGYMGIGFIGGGWRGNTFYYNRAVMRVNDRYIHHTYDDRTIIRTHMIENTRRVSYNGGRGGIVHAPTAHDRMAMREKHMGRTTFQNQHVQAARSDRAAYFNNNHGRPDRTVVDRPMSAPRNMHQAPRNVPNSRPQVNRQHEQPRNFQARPMPQQRTQPRQQPHVNPHFEQRPMPQSHPQPRPQVQPHPQVHPQSRPQARPQSHPEPHPHPQGRGSRGGGHPR